MRNSPVRDSLYREFIENNMIDPKLYEKYDVKRGLRNADGTGVVAGLTNICNVHGYVINEGERQPIEGELIFRGYNIKDLVGNAIKEDRFGYEETVYLLLMGKLPSLNELDSFKDIIANNRELPDSFFEDMILKAPSKNIMNKLARSVLALYSYDDDPENRSPEYEMATAVSIIAKLPTIMVDAYQVKRRYFNNETMFMHPLINGHSTAEMILSTLRANRQFTHEARRRKQLNISLPCTYIIGNRSVRRLFRCNRLS